MTIPHSKDINKNYVQPLSITAHNSTYFQFHSQVPNPDNTTGRQLTKLVPTLDDRYYEPRCQSEKRRKAESEEHKKIKIKRKEEKIESATERNIYVQHALQQDSVFLLPQQPGMSVFSHYSSSFMGEAVLER